MALTVLGAFLVLYGLTLDWPCSANPQYSASCIQTLKSAVFEQWQIALALAVYAALLAASVRWYQTPMNYAAWLSFWPFYFFLIKFQWFRYDFDGAFPNTRVPGFWISEETGLAAGLVLPLCLAAFWLAMRPEPLRKSLRWLAVLACLLLLIATPAAAMFGYIPSYALPRLLDGGIRGLPLSSIFTPAPLAVLFGACLLLAEEVALERRKPAPQG